MKLLDSKSKLLRENESRGRMIQRVSPTISFSVDDGFVNFDHGTRRFNLRKRAHSPVKHSQKIPVDKQAHGKELAISKFFQSNRDSECQENSPPLYQ